MHVLSKLILASSLALAAIYAPHAWAGPAEDQYAVAAAHYQQARWKLAAAEFRTFLADYPDHAKTSRAIFYLAESLVQLREFDQAAVQFLEFRR